MSELPKGWESDLLGNLVHVERGSSPRPIKDFITEAEDGVNWVKIGDMKEGQKYVTSTREKITKAGALKSRFVGIGDFILSNSMSYGRPYIMAIEGYIHDGWFAIRLPNGIDTNYFYYLLSSSYIQNQFNQLAVGGVVKNISGDLVKKASLPIPPLAEQKRIVEKLDQVLAQVDTIKARLDGIPAILKRFRQSVLAAAVSGKLTEEWRGEDKLAQVSFNEIKLIKENLIKNKVAKKDLEAKEGRLLHSMPKEWLCVKLCSVALKITDGEHKTPKREGTGNYLLSARNVRDGYIALDNVDYVGDEEFSKLRKRCDPNKGDILISCSGSVGRVCLVDEDDKYVMVRSAALVRGIDEIIFNKFMMLALQSPMLQKNIEDSSRSTAQSNLFLGPIKELDIPLPSLEEQTEIVRLVDQYFAFANTIEQQVQKAQQRVDKLTQSILAKAFRGELVPQDPTDEPADELLKRIAAARAESEALAKAAKKVGKKTGKS
ncbi:restriction endonuclease subunit S [Marinomonas sp. TW1]|uniref:restriction endonuclease subunit S n=1 Tax=Marinomonas sp. TW1 TaxID=1561203 RepID=UPI0007AF7FE5|nr:restriction endonuclease subunit S [Marinomonas sp. TW1]KZN14621.1 hypothetical protein OA79_04975 [Marinomonas sp. TW1]